MLSWHSQLNNFYLLAKPKGSRMKTFFNGAWHIVERNNQGGVDMTRDISLLDICFSVSMLGMGAMLLSFAVDCESASVGVKTFSILSGGILMIISALSLD